MSVKLSRELQNIINYMLEFQRINGIVSECMTNVQILYDIVNSNVNQFKDGTKYDIKVKPYIVLSSDDVCKIVSQHVILDINGLRIDPSYETTSLKNRIYFKDFKEFMDHLSDNSKKLLDESFDLKTILEGYVNSVNISERMNKGEFMISNKQYYDNQFDYIAKKLNKAFIHSLINSSNNCFSRPSKYSK